ncbi:MAG: hypothetical protein NTU76_00180 [Candidatus Taylorbacteria bacterium]|nr:hypothetical protein [Candidatus Taylorbacteria bacterium]
MGHAFGSTNKLKEKFLSIFKDIGIIAHVCEGIGISRSTFHRWIEGDGKFASDFNMVVCENFDTHREMWRQIPVNKQNIFIWGAFELEKEGSI